MASGNVNNFIHIPKTAGTSIRQVLPGAYLGHRQAKSLTPDQLAGAWTVTRNPYDRAVSLYTEVTRFPVSTNLLKEYWGDLDKMRLRMRRRSYAEWVIEPQSHWIFDGDEQLIPTLVSIEELPRFVEGEFGVKLPHLNVGEGSPDYDYLYDDELRDIIYTLFEEDFINLGYGS